MSEPAGVTTHSEGGLTDNDFEMARAGSTAWAGSTPATIARVA
jgi:pterin-4a-carbinolamine dehydratase